MTADDQLITLGTDHEDRVLTFDKSTQSFAIGGIATGPDRVVAYDRGKQIDWVSEDLRKWAYDCAQHQWARAAEERAAATPAPPAPSVPHPPASHPSGWSLVKGYDPGSTVKLVHGFEIAAWVLAALLVVGSMIEGAVVDEVLRSLLPGAGTPVGVLLTVPALLLAALLIVSVRLAGQLLRTLVQIEVNTRPRQ